MNDLERLLQRQAAWQKSLRLLPWPEKLRLSLRMRETALRFKELRERDRNARRDPSDPEQS